MKTTGSPCSGSEDSWPWALAQSLFNAAWAALLLFPISIVLIPLGGLVLPVLWLMGVGAFRITFDLWVFVACRKDEAREWPRWVINVKGPVAEATIGATIFAYLAWGAASTVLANASDLWFILVPGTMWLGAVGYVILVTLHGTRSDRRSEE